MKLFALAAFVAVCGAAKLDRTYLPPASAKSAGGSPGSLQTPFAANSLNNGLGGLPKGSYTNDFQGVVVDAALAGTRASGETGLGAPRITYGSTDSKVGGAAFRVQHPRPGFSQPGFNQAQGSQPSYSQSQGSQPDFNQPQNAQPSFNQPQVPQPSFNQPQSSLGFNQQSSDSNQKSERPQAAFDRAANTVKLSQEVGPENYNFAFETDNGITAEERGVATNDGVMAEGGYSYTGDDGQTYTVTYVADENGYQPKGDHLPTPPPIPEEILKSLEQNAKDEAAGLVDDGMYDPKKYNTEGDYTADNNDDGKYTHQSGFGDGSETDASASSSFIDQNRRPFGKPNKSGGSGSQNGVNTVEHNTKPGKFNHQGSRPSLSGASNQSPGPESQNPGQIDQNGAFAMASVQNGASSFGQNAKLGKYDHQGSRPSLSGPSNQSPGPESQNPAQFDQNGAFAFPSVQNGASSFGLNAKPGKFDHPGSRPSLSGPSNQLPEPESQNPGQFDQNGAFAFAGVQNGANPFGQNAKPGKFDHPGSRPSEYGPSNQFTGSDSQMSSQFGQSSGPGFSGTENGASLFGQNAVPGKFDHQGPRPSAFGSSNQMSGSDFQNPGQFSQNVSPGFYGAQNSANSFGQNAKPGKFDNEGSQLNNFASSNQSPGSDSLHPGRFGQNSVPGFSDVSSGANIFGQNDRLGQFDHQASRPSGSEDQSNGPVSQFSQSGIPNEFTGQTNYAISQASITPTQTGGSSTGAKPNTSGFSSGSNAYAETSFQGFGNKNQYIPPVNNAYGQQETPTKPQDGPQIKPQSKPQDSGSSESSSSEENSSEEDGSLGNQPQPIPQKPSAQDFPTRVSSRPMNAFSGQSSFGMRPTQNTFLGNEMRPSNSNNLAVSGQQSQPNEYLPPFPLKPDQNQIGSSPNQQTNGNNQAPGFQSPFPKPEPNEGHPQNSYPSSASPQLPFSSQPTFEIQQFNSFQNPQTGKPNFQHGIDHFSSQQAGQFIQNGAFNIPNEAQFSHQSQSSPSAFNPFASFTPQPDNGMTNPLESTDKMAEQGPTKPSETSPVKPMQLQYGNQVNNGQYSSPSSTPAFDFGIPSTPAAPELLPFYQFQSGNIVAQTQNRGEDSQFAPSTQRPNYAQQVGSNEPYVYNQPSQAFMNQGSSFSSQVSSFSDIGSSYPSTSSNQFGSVTQSPSYPTDRYSNSPENSPSSAPVQYSPQGPINYPNPPTLPSAYPTTSTQYQGNTVSGITQAAISSFPSVAPTQTPFNMQNQFQSRPGFQQTTNKFNQGFPESRPSSELAPSTIAPQTVTNGPSGAEQTFDQESTQSSEDSSETPVTIHQYQGELYEYNKPAQLPPAPENEGRPGAGQFGVTIPAKETTQPESEGSRSTVAPQFGFQQTGQPQFEAKPSRLNSQSTLNPEGTTMYPEEQSTDDTTSQFISNPSQPQNNQNSQSQSPQSRPQGAQSNSFNSQLPEDSENPKPQEQPTKAPFGLRPCCQGSSKLGQNRKPGSQNKFPFQLGSGFNAAQSTSSRPTMNSFVGQGETFDATRKPPSFDENGYHY